MEKIIIKTISFIIKYSYKLILFLIAWLFIIIISTVSLWSMILTFKQPQLMQEFGDTEEILITIIGEELYNIAHCIKS